MSYLKPQFSHPRLPKNKLGYTLKEYEGSLSTLCAGCGHDSISAAIVRACYELEIEPHLVAKISGIGCSSKTPTYFLGNSHGFNSVHGRMPSVATGANMANRDLVYFGVSGDGDSASIGMGQFVHVIRRNLNMVYVVMNNGCYGLTKGQDSATADLGSKNKSGAINPFHAIDLASLAIELGASFVGQSFSGDKQQLIPLMKAAIRHPGFAFLNVLSPCVTFNNNPGSTKSYDYVREHVEVTSARDLVPIQTEISIEYEQGTSIPVTMHDDSEIQLNKLDRNWDPKDRLSAVKALQKARMKQEILTGLLYVTTEWNNLHETLHTCQTPLNKLTEKDLNPGKELLDLINERFR